MTTMPPTSNNPPMPPYGVPQYMPTTRETSVMAVISFVAGLLWLFWFGSIIAVILGHLAHKECREQGKGGDALALIGLVLGYIGLGTLGMFFFLGMLGAAGS
jgi:hypothetical protein